jgi:hypothetical protein
VQGEEDFSDARHIHSIRKTVTCEDYVNIPTYIDISEENGYS